MADLSSSSSSRKLRTTSLAARACTNCRKRKSRCIGSAIDGQSCNYCARTGKECSFEEPTDRTPLKRKNLDAAESRCLRLRSLLQSLNPDLDIDAALAKLEAAPQHDEWSTSGSSRAQQQQQQQQQQQADGSGKEGGGEETEEARYGWHEDFSEDALGSQANVLTADCHVLEQKEDGMGTFSTADSGYLGSSSASSLLQDIASLLGTSGIVDGTAIGTSPEAAVHRSSPPRSSLQFDPPDLASAAATSLLIDSYFLFYNTSYPIVHEKSFRAKAASDWRHSRSHATWSIVYYMVLAIGHWLSVTSSNSRPPAPFFAAARSRMSISVLESANLETLQAFLLMGNYLQKRGRPNTGYNLIGIACRVAFGLGLHREPPNAVDNMLHERRRQLFWTVYCFDSGFNITTGRPPTATEGFVDIQLPRNVDDKDCTLTTGVVTVVDYPTPCSAIIAQARLAKIADAIYRDFLMAKTAGSKIPYQVADSFEKILGDWRQHLPHYFVSTDVPNWFLGPRTVVLWKSQNLRILLWRGVEKMHPFMPSKPEANRRCLNAATQAVHEITSFCQQWEDIMHIGINWYATYFLFQATLVVEAGRLSVELRNDVDQELWQSSVASSRACLGMLSKKNSSVGRFLEVLDKIHNHNLPVVSTSAPATGLNLCTHSSSVAQAFPLSQDDSHLVDGMFAHLSGHQPTCPDASGFNPNEYITDSTLQMLINQMPLDFFEQQARAFSFA